MALQTYRDLEVWQRAMDLVELVYVLIRKFPDEEKYGITAQLRGAVVSIPTNISEGYGQTHRGDYLRFLSIARGSLCEVETLLILAGRLKFATREELTPSWEMSQRVGKMLLRLMKSLADQTQTRPALKG
jgi:four helix bundle protein